MAAAFSSANTGRCNVRKIRPRNYLLEEEVVRMVKAARRNRHGDRDAALILMAYKHGYRVSELVEMQWSHVDIANGHGRLHVVRRKGSFDSAHPLHGDEIKLLKRLRQRAKSQYVFESERGGSLKKREAQHLIEKAGLDGGLEFPVSAHMLRHGCGYRLANQGATTRDIQEFLGHANLNNVTRYTRLNSKRFEGFV
jgi:type 1 fimbriae regulatory protein FimB/type 1 fimbriae regulatory protein FimE